MKIQTMPNLLGGWRCNGGINPLIRDEPHLMTVAGPEFLEAVRWVAIHMHAYKRPGLPAAVEEQMQKGVFDPTCEQIHATLGAFFADRNHPRWKLRPELIPGTGIHTAAQLMAKHGNLDWYVKCEDCADLIQCFTLMQGYNNFDPREAIEKFLEFNPRAYYNRCNPNNGADLFEYHLAAEGSHAVYIEFRGGMRIESMQPMEVEAMTPEEFDNICDYLGMCLMADENHLQPVTTDCLGGKHLTWRLWWD